MKLLLFALCSTIFLIRNGSGQRRSRADSDLSAATTWADGGKVEWDSRGATFKYINSDKTDKFPALDEIRKVCNRLMEDGTYNTRQVKQILAKLNAKGTDYFGKFLKLRELQTLTDSTVTDKGLYRKAACKVMLAEDDND